MSAQASLLLDLTGIRGATRCELTGREGFTLAELLVAIAIMGLVMAAIVTVDISGNTLFLTGENQAQAQQAARAAMLMEEDLRLAGYGYPPALTKISAASPSSITFWADLDNSSTTLAAPVAAGARTLNVASVAGINPGDGIYLINGSQWDALTVRTITGSSVNVSGSGPGNAYPQGALVGRPRAVTYSWAAATNTLSKDPGDGTGLQPIAVGVQVQLTYFDTSDAAIPAGSLPSNLAKIGRIAIATTAQSTATQNPGRFTVTTTVRPRN